MKYVSDGRGSQLPLVSLLAMLAVSLTVNLPGLAISPIMGKLDDVFPHAGQFQIQLLSVLPNLVIIPFILLAGKFTTRKNQSAMLATGLGIFTAAGVMCFFARTMTQLIVLGAIIGVGCGMVVPIAAGLLGEYFSGSPRVRVLGMKSGTSNGIVVLATLFVGWVAAYGWHAAFAVYLIPAIPLLLLPFMTRGYIERNTRTTAGIAQKQTAAPAATSSTPEGLEKVKKPLVTLAGLITIYMLMTYASMVFSYYLPFTMKHYGLSTAQVGVASCMFYITAMTGGFTLSPFIKICGRNSIYVSMLITLAGIVMLGIFHEMWAYVVGVLLIGIGYGFFQPIIYNKTTRIAATPDASTRFFSYTLTGSYVALAILPVVVKAFEGLFDNHTADFPYFLNAAILGVTIIVGIVAGRRSFVWRVE